MDNTINMLPKLYTVLDTDTILLFNKLLINSFKAKEVLSSREERRFRKQIRADFENKGIQNSSELASIFIDIGIYKNIEEYMNLVKHKNSMFILKCAYYLALQRKNSNNILLAVNKASKVVFALKNYSRKDLDDKMGKVSLIENIETVLTLYQNQFKHGIEIRKYFDIKIPEIYCYPDELSQVWTNLITNAVQAMTNKGILEIAVKDQNEAIEVMIRDYGSGIPEEIKHRIFDPFFTTKIAGEGTGLGLDIVKKIVEKHKGQINVESKEGIGTTFTVLIPVKEEINENI